MILASFNRRSKNIVIEAVVILELTFRDVQRQIFAAYFVITTYDAALKDAPETLNRIGVDRADDMLADAVINNAVRVCVPQTFIDIVGVSAEQANFIGNGFADKVLDFHLIDAVDNASDDIALALDRADDRSFEPVIATAARSAALIPMPVFVLAADIRFVDFDNAAEFGRRFNQSGADFVAHTPSGLVAAKAHKSHDLEGAHSLFAGEHQMGDLEPIPERLIRVLKNGPGDAGEPIALRSTGPALPMEGFVAGGVVKVRVAAARTNDALVPSTGHQIGLAGRFVPNREHDLELGAGELVNGLWTLGHNCLPTMEAYCHV